MPPDLFRKRTSIAVALLAILAEPASACSWEGLTPENVAVALPARFDEADSVVLARVASVTERENDLLATLEVTRSYKGQTGQLEVIGLRWSTCGYRFTVGEVKIFLITRGEVRVPSVYPVTPWLLAALERARAR
jgi:hypothetical protein